MKKENKPKTTQDKDALQHKQEIELLENNWKRALADYKNLQKRSEEEKESIIKFANQVLISKLILITDSLEMLQNHIKDIGLEMIIKEFKQIMEEEGLKEIDVIDAKYDANTMEAIELVPGEQGKIIEVVQKGYTLKNRILRPAKVKVGNEELVN